MADLTGPIDRAALERILKRATELQAGDREIGEGMTPEEVLALGKEVGIPARFLQQAMLEERSRVVPAAEPGIMDQLIGPAEVAAQRVVQGEVETLQRALVRWMDEHELLTIQREQPGRVSWEPLTGAAAAIRRAGAAFESRPFMLRRASTVAATLTPLEPGYVLVRLTADVRPARSGFVGGAATFFSFG
ncbi:MAG: hypothetical protein ACOY71_05140, partial [Gemmatimonadota bacterium]